MNYKPKNDVDIVLGEAPTMVKTDAKCWVDGGGLPELERLLDQRVTGHHDIIWI